MKINVLLHFSPLIFSSSSEVNNTTGTHTIDYDFIRQWAVFETSEIYLWPSDKHWLFHKFSFIDVTVGILNVFFFFAPIQLNYIGLDIGVAFTS